MGRDAVPEGDPWPDVRRTVMAHRGELVERIATHGTQTNEVNRAVYVAAALAAAAADAPDVPVALVELGASAGLLLGVDRYAVELAPAASTETASGTEPAPVWLGDVDSPVRCSGLDRTGFAGRLALAGVAVPPVHGRVGIDLAPVALDDDDGVRWLEACLWPDVPGRVERFRAARDLLRADPPAVLRGDMVDDLPRAVARARDEAGVGAHVVVLSSWALTYVPGPRRLELEGTLARLAGELARLSWLTAEPPGCAPGIEPPPGPDDGAEGNSSGTVVGLRRWRGGRELDAVTLGTCHPHGTWVDLRADAVVGPTS